MASVARMVSLCCGRLCLTVCCATGVFDVLDSYGRQRYIIRNAMLIQQEHILNAGCI